MTTYQESMQTSIGERTSSQHATSASTDSPDPSWRRLYRIGGIAAFLYILLGLILPAVMMFSVDYDLHMEAAVFLEYIAAHRNWWLTFQSLVLAPSLLAIVVFLALFVALKQVDKSNAAVGAVIAIVCQTLFTAYYPVLLGLVYLSDRYTAVEEAYRPALVSAAEALIAMNNAFNPVYEGVFAVSILFLSIAMLKGVFSKTVAYLGIAVAPAAIVALLLWPLVGVAYFWWWLVFLVWFMAVGWKLYRLGGAEEAPA